METGITDNYSKRSAKAIEILWLSIFIVLTINDTSSNIQHKQLNQFILIVAAMAYAFSQLWWFQSVRAIERSTLSSILLYGLLIIYGLLLSQFYGGDEFLSWTLYNYLALSIVFLFAMSSVPSERIQLRPYIYLSLASIYLLGALSFDPIPRIDLVMRDGEYRDYSQGLSFVFGLFCVAMYSDILAGERPRESTLLFFLCFAVCILGAARGEFMALCAVLLIASMRASILKTFGTVIAGVFIFSFFIDPVALAENILLVVRLLQIDESNLGMRDILWVQGWELIVSNSDLITGNGFNYFQHYYDYDFGLYPHNLLIEVVISFGVAGVLLSAASLAGFFLSTRNMNVKNCILAFIYLSYMKSGSLISFFGLPVMIIYSTYTYQYLRGKFPRGGRN